MPFPASSLFDTFTGSLVDLNSHDIDGWTAPNNHWFSPGWQAGIEIDGSGHARGKTGSTQSYNWTYETATSADYGGAIIVRKLSEAGKIGVMLGIASNNTEIGTHFYLGLYNAGTAQFEIYRVTAGTLGSPIASASGSLADGDTLDFERTVSGSDAILTIKKNGSTVVGPFTDTAPASQFLDPGQFGLYVVPGATVSSTGFQADRIDFAAVGGGGGGGPTSVTLGGAQSGTVGQEASISLTLDAAAGVGGVVVNLSSATINAAFRLTSGGSNLSPAQVTIAQGQTVLNFFLVPGAAGTGSWSAASSLVEFGSPRSFTATNATLSVSPTSVTAGTSGNTLTLTGSQGNWTPGTPGSPTFTVDSGTITAQTVNNGTTATLTYTAPAPSSGSTIITDPSTGATATLTIVGASSSGARPIGFQNLPTGLASAGGVTLYTIDEDGDPHVFAARSNATLREDSLVAGYYTFVVPDSFGGKAIFDDGGTVVAALTVDPSSGSGLDAYDRAMIRGNVMVDDDRNHFFYDVDSPSVKRLRFAPREEPGGRIVTKDPT